MRKLFRKNKPPEDDMGPEWYKVIMKEKGITINELNDLLKFALLSLNMCNTVHQDTGKDKIALSDIAKEIGTGVTTKNIQESFHLLVRIGVIADDGDYDFMNYDQNSEVLKEQITQLKNSLETN